MPELTGATGPGRLLRVVMIGLIVVTIVFATLRISVDVPYLASGTTPDEGSFESSAGTWRTRCWPMRTSCRA